MALTLGQFRETNLAPAFGLVILLLATASPAAEVKQDLLGFYPGMTASQFDGQLATFLDSEDKDQSLLVRTMHWILGYPGCPISREKLFEEQGIRCKTRKGEFAFSFTKYARPAILRAVSFKFFSGTRAAEMASQISEQYGLAPKEVPGDFNLAIARGASLFGLKAKVAVWQLPNGAVLQLDGDNAFELSLSSPEINDLDGRTLRQELLSKNPKPQF